MRAPAKLCVTFAALLMGATKAHAAGSLEYALKATYLTKFAPFVQWPDSVFASADSPIVICVYGADPFGPLLDQAAAGQRVGARPIAVRHIATVAAGDGCHIGFLGGNPQQPVTQGLEILRLQPVLTVTDNAPDKNSHGIVNFIIVDNHVRFEIDERAAAQNHITISSKLLTLARPPGQVNKE